MVARLIEGWESSTVIADYLGKWTTTLGTGALGTSSGRFGNGLRMSGTTSYVQRVLDNQATWVVGVAIRVGVIPTSPISVITLIDGATVHAGIAVADTTGLLQAFRASTGTVLGTSSVGLVLNTWAYVETKITINDTTGSVVVRLNGATVLNLTGIDTRNAGNASANTIRIGIAGGTMATDFDDIYLFDATGSVNNDFAGDCRVEQLLPSGAGATTAWTPSAGANYACVDEVPPNADTDYVSSATAGQTDTYAFGDLSVASSGVVKAVQATVQARKDDAGSRSLALIARPGGTDRVGATQAVADTYATYPQVWDTNPDTAAAWTVAEVNASVFGARLMS